MEFMSPDILEKRVETKIANLFKDKDGIVRITLDHKDDMTIDDVKELGDAILRISGDNKAVIFMKSVNYKLPSRKVRAHPAEEGVIKALAYLVNNSVSKTAANFFIKINKPPFPFKLFTDEKEAITWLKKFQT